jgi:hypothetical protein
MTSKQREIAFCELHPDQAATAALAELPGARQSNPDNTRKVFIDRYHRLNHDCRDNRPAIWRDYR